MVLDIDKNFVKFYDYEFLQVDSLRKNGEDIQTNSEVDQLILRRTNSSENKSFHTHTYDYFVLTSKDKIDWKLQKETKKSTIIHFKKQVQTLAEEIGQLV